MTTSNLVIVIALVTIAINVKVLYMLWQMDKQVSKLHRQALANLDYAESLRNEAKYDKFDKFVNGEGVEDAAE